ncbi:S41 family peptidase [Hymenobacter elongatus]|uniref:Tail specific protease domain-containing protein n=1 Tax=Hymenobacter elongatus TaxID=877208 RepID=A0A4Z0PF30_9BACT|nr:S41 family peptidase [Hymenobacter elongatus]TGE13432.1 hypothetical protein E5J99_19395 [Hymenobacter elongatus]
MKHFLGLVLCGFLAFSAAAQNITAPLPDSVKAHLDNTLAVLQANALGRDNIDWAGLRTTVYQKVQGARTVRETLPVYAYIFEQLHDDHGYLTYKGKDYKWRKPRAAYANAAVKAAVAQKPTIRVRVLEGRIGYVQLPGNSPGGSLEKMRQEAQLLRDSLCAINSNKIKAWIIDLRLNTGGSMAPMLGGLGTLIGDGPLGGFVDKDGKPDGNWYLRHGDFYFDTLAATHSQDRCPVRRTDKPIAVLLSGLTASSGEIVAIGLHGRPATRFFGEPTYGLTTANAGYPVDKDTFLTIAALVEADRTGKLHAPNVLPDVLITGGDNFAEPTKDAKVLAALQWLKTQKAGQKR